MKPGRNDPCSCGSGKKFKHCCEGKTATGTAATPAPDVLNQLVTLYNARRYAEVESRAQTLVAQFPSAGIVWKMLGVSQQLLGKNALAAFQKTAELMPKDPEALFNLGVAQKNVGQLDAATESLRRAIKLKPLLAKAHSELGAALYGLGKVVEATECYRKTAALMPDSALAQSNLAAALFELGKAEEAVTACRQAVKLSPDNAEAYNNLGTFLKETGKFDEAEASYRKALQLNPQNFKAYGNLGNLLKDRGRLEEAKASYRAAIRIKPDIPELQGNLLFTLSFSPDDSHNSYLELAKKYGQTVSAMARSRFTTWQCTEPPVRLRVGLVSGDLRNHPAGYFLESLLAHLDSKRIELIAYPSSPKADALTERIKPCFSAWRPLYGLSDESAASLIHSDGVHVLLDLAGHTANNRLPIFAWKPAPVQTSWLGYWASTGVSEMDFLIADHTGVPEEHRQHFSEKVWYLPDTRLCFSPPDTDQPVSTLPALQNGFITFGCFQIMPKVGDEVLDLWSAVLNSLPDSRLRWQCPQFKDPAISQQLLQRFQERGIDPARISLLGSVDREGYLAAHAEVDVLLDTFPFTGGTTTCEALWMGVPTITLAGDTLLSRQGASLLSAAGLEDWITSSKADYIARATALQDELPELSSLRASLRKQVSESPLFDAPRFARNLEDALWGMWQSK